MPAAIRMFERSDRDQLTALVNVHVAAVIPGVVLSVNSVLGQLEREPQEAIVDPWVAERRCLVAERSDGIVAAALLHRFRGDEDVSESFRGTGEIRWLVCRPDALEEGARLVQAALARMRDWQVRSIGAECSLPAPACYGIPDSLPHLRRLLTDAGFGEPTRAELVLVAPCEALARHPSEGLGVTRTLGALGARFALSREEFELGHIEVSDQPIEMARNSVAVRWGDIGNLAVRDPKNRQTVLPALLAVAAQWLLLGGVTRLLTYWTEGADPMDELTELQRAGFQRLVRNERGFRL